MHDMNRLCVFLDARSNAVHLFGEVEQRNLDAMCSAQPAHHRSKTERRGDLNEQLNLHLISALPASLHSNNYQVREAVAVKSPYVTTLWSLLQKEVFLPVLL